MMTSPAPSLFFRPQFIVRIFSCGTALAWVSRAAAQAAPSGPEEDIRGPRPKVEIPVPEVFDWTLWIIAAVIIIAVVAFFFWWRERLPRRLEIAAGDRALKVLHELDRERNTLEPGPLADHAAGIVRQFVAEKFGIAAPQRTTEEFLRSLESAPPLTAHRDLLHSFLHSCDAAKFAGTEFDAAERLTLLQNGIHFVRAAGASPPPAPSPPSAAAE
jgi:hypothetical protein